MSDIKTIDTLIEDVYSVLDGRNITEIGSRFSEEIIKILEKRSQPRGEPRLRMSNLGRPLRQLYYELNGFKGEELTGKTQFKFLYGELIEATFIVLAELSGHKVERLQEEVEVDGVKGSIDLVCDGVLLDVKSCSPYSFRKFETGSLFESDPFGYIGQLSGYASRINLPCRFVAVDKVSGDICMLEVPEEVVKEYNVPKRIVEVREAVSKPTPPPRCYEPVPVSKTDKSGNLVLGIGCSYCGHKEECWKDANNGEGLKIFYYSTGPKWFTEVKKQPRVQEKFPTKQEEGTDLTNE